MKVLHISDVPSNPAYFHMHNSPANIIQEVKNKHLNTDIFIINLNYKSENISRADNAGILFLKYLRLYHFSQHCVLYSFLSREQLMLQDPHNLIIFSEGVTYVRLPFDFSSLDFAVLVKQTAPAYLATYFKAESRLAVDRHFVANWWGVLQLCAVHRIVAKQEFDTYNANIEKTIEASLNGLHSYHGLLARYLNPGNEKEMDAYLKLLQKQKQERFGDKQRNISHINNLLIEKTEEYDVITQKLEVLRKAQSYAHDRGRLPLLLEKIKMASPPLQMEIKQLIDAQQSTKHDISILNEYITLQNSIEQEQIHLNEQLIDLDNEILNSINKLESLKTFSTQNYTLTESRKNLAKSKPKILYVDDQANEGWAQIFQHMIYGTNDKGHFRIFQPLSSQSIDEIESEVLEAVNHFEPKLLILDLRLKGETGIIENINDLSGIQVLNRIRKEKVNCPVLITTASNKSWSFRETLSLGASAFWTKEGLDDHYNTSRTVDNYMRFVDLVHVLTLSEEFDFLREFNTRISTIEKNSSQYWWETDKKEIVNATITITPADKNNVVDILWNAYDILLNNLNIRLFTHNPSQFSQYYLSLVVTRLAAVLETIHKVDSKLDMTLRPRMQARIGSHANTWQRMIDIRNDAVHLQNTTYSELVNFTTLLFDYFDAYKPKVKSITNYMLKDTEYASKIEQVKNTTSGQTYYKLEIPEGISFEINCFINESNPLLNRTLQVGSVLKYKLELKTRKDRSLWYSAYEATLINND